MKHEKTCFVICPIGEQESETRKRSDQVLKHIIRPAVESCGYGAVRADEIDKPGIITSQVIQHIVSDQLVVADLTERNPNVFYELAIRHALRKPLVQIIKKGESIPFDVAGTRTISVDHRDLDSVENAKNEICDQIKALEKDSSDIETPISVSLDLQLLRQSEKPEERSIADLVAAVSDLRNSLIKIESRLGTKEQQGILDDIQAQIRNIPAMLDEAGEFARSPSRRMRMSTRMIREMVHMTPDVPGVEILIVASYFRDLMPWLHELGLETYRTVRSARNRQEAISAVKEFYHAVEYSIHNPLFREMIGRGGKDIYMFMEDVEPILRHTVDRFAHDERPARRPSRKEAAEAEN
jgi:hypothetical protein